MAQPEPPPRRRRALLVAAATYEDPKLAALRSPAGDVDALAGVLEDEQIGAFEVRRLVDRPTEELKKEIEGFFADARPQDLLLLYVSGHGVLSQTRRFYLATATTSLQWLRATAIEDGFINDVMQHSRARSIVLVLDCCHSGAFGKGLAPKSPVTVDVEHRFEGRGRVTLSASTELEYAFEETDPAGEASALAPGLPGSLFTRCLVEGLATGEADVDADGRISVDELYDYVAQRMREGPARQTPGLAGEVRGDIVIARSRRAAELPAELRQAIESPLAGVREGAVTELAALHGGSDARLAAAAGTALARLAEDDSQRVSARARAALGGEPPVAAPAAVAAPPAATAPAAPAGPKRRRHAPARSRLVAAAVAAALLAGGAAVVLIEGGGEPARTLAYDFDGDGAQEVVVAPLFGDSAQVLLHPGPTSRRASSISAAAAGATDVAAGESFGTGVTSADFDGDGHADLAVGTPDDDLVTVLHGTRLGLDGRTQRLPGDRISHRYGFELLGRDLDEDGFDDLVVGAPGTGKQHGAVHVLFGGKGGLRTAGARLIRAPAPLEDDFGSRLRTGDVDGDGHVDLVAGAPDPLPHLTYCPGSERGPVRCQVLPAFEGDNGTSGLAVADLDADGHDDIVQGDPEVPPDGSGGALRVWLGGPGGPSRTPLVIRPATIGLRGVGHDAAFGTSVDAARIDGDPYADIVVGVPGLRGGAGGVALIVGGEDVVADGGHRLHARPRGEGLRFGADLALLDLAGGDDLELVVVAEEAGFDGVVQVLADGDGEPVRLHGLDRVAGGETVETRVGRSAGATGGG